MHLSHNCIFYKLNHCLCLVYQVLNSSKYVPTHKLKKLFPFMLSQIFAQTFARKILTFQQLSSTIWLMFPLICKQVGNMAWKSSSLTHFGKAPNLFHYRSYTEALIASNEDPVAGWIHNLVLNEWNELFLELFLRS